MDDLFKDKAEDWDLRPNPAKISQGVFAALQEAIPFDGTETVLDFGAGTGLLAGKLAPLVGTILAVDISEAMLERLAAKPELRGKVEIHCQNLLEDPLGRKVDLVVSAMAMHHVEDTAALLRVLHAHLRPGGRIALADLDAEDGRFHTPGTQGVYHPGFQRDALATLLDDVGFEDPRFVTACEIDREGRNYPIFLVTASRRGD